MKQQLIRQTDKQAFLATLPQCYYRKIVCCCMNEADRPAYSRSICCKGHWLPSFVPCSCSSACTAALHANTHNLQGACLLSCSHASRFGQGGILLYMYCSDALLTQLQHCAATRNELEVGHALAHTGSLLYQVLYTSAVFRSHFTTTPSLQPPKHVNHGIYA